METRTKQKFHDMVTEKCTKLNAGNNVEIIWVKYKENSKWRSDTNAGTRIYENQKATDDTEHIKIN